MLISPSEMNNILVYSKQLSNRIEAKMNQRLKDKCITFQQARVLTILSLSEEKCYSLKELERIFHVTQQTMVGIAHRLEQEDMVIIAPDPNDKRAKLVRLADKGERLAAMLQEELANVHRWLSENVSEEELKTTAQTLKTLNGCINAI